MIHLGHESLGAPCPTKTGKLRRSAIDGRTTRHAGYGLSQQRRRAIEPQISGFFSKLLGKSQGLDVVFRANRVLQ
jgi:hypothetical protein